MGFPWTPPRRHKEGGPACPPSLETPSLGDGSREPPSHGQKAVPAPLLRKGGIPRNHLAFSGKVPSYPQQPRCGSEKRTAGHPEMLPAFSCSYAVEWSKPPATTGPNPRNRRRERSGRSPECRRPSLFLLHHQKALSLFPRKGAPHKSPAKRVLWGRGGATERYEGCPLPQGVPNIAQFAPTTKGGFEAAGLPRHPRANGKRSVPAAEPQAIGLRRTLPRPGTGRPTALPQGKIEKSKSPPLARGHHAFLSTHVAANPRRSPARFMAKYRISYTVAALRFPAPSGPPIAPLPRNRLAFSAAGGASPVSLACR